MAPDAAEHAAQGRAAPIPMRHFPPAPASVAEVRRMVAGHLGDVPEACRDTVVCIASELAANAVLHAGTAYVVELQLGDVVRIEVSDTGPPAPFLVAVPPTAESGLGLSIVSKLSDRWGVEWLDECKVVWAEVPFDARPLTETETRVFAF